MSVERAVTPWDGYPLHRERDGTDHWLDIDGDLIPARWDGGLWLWMGMKIPPAMAAQQTWRYLGPCLTPSEHSAAVTAARIAEREAAAGVAEGIARQCVEDAAEATSKRLEMTASWLSKKSDAAAECAAAILAQPLPTDDALAELLARAWDAGREAAVHAKVYQHPLTAQQIEGIEAMRSAARALRNPHRETHLSPAEQEVCNRALRRSVSNPHREDPR